MKATSIVENRIVSRNLDLDRVKEIMSYLFKNQTKNWSWNQFHDLEYSP